MLLGFKFVVFIAKIVVLSPFVLIMLPCILVFIFEEEDDNDEDSDKVITLSETAALAYFESKAVEYQNSSKERD